MTGTRTVTIVVTALAVVASVAGCGRTVSGSAHPAGETQTINTDFDKLLRECEVVDPIAIGKAVGDESSYAAGSFNGAVCMWDVQSAGGSAMVTLNWYEIGSLATEKTTVDKLGYTARSVTVQGSRALEVRRPNDADSCGVTGSAADTGVVGWWINYRAGSGHPDPCAGATKLLELTLNLAR